MSRFWNWLRSLFHSAPPPLYMGVSVFCGWANPRPEWGQVPGVQCPVQYPWAALKTRDRVPALGEYDERSPGVTQARCEWMQQGKVDFAVYQVEWDYWANAFLTSHCADNHPTSSPVQFTLSFFNVLDGASDSYLPTFTQTRIEASWRAFAQAVRSITSRPNYLKLNGRPVLFLGYAGRTSAVFIDILHQEIPNIYLVATAVDPNAMWQLKVKGFDAFTEYLLYSDSWPNVMATYRDRWNLGISVAKQTGIDYWVPATVGYNSAAWGSPEKDVFIPTPAEFTAHLKEARQFARDNAKYTRGRIITYAWNEFGEGGIIEPLQADMLHSGNEMLLAHAASVV